MPVGKLTFVWLAAPARVPYLASFWM